jgi:molybdenum-dependent DNA-binding transcriptional regulator ModE
MRHVILTTTIWRNLPPKFPGLGEQREKELRDNFGAGMIAAGLVIKRFCDSYASAWDVLDATNRPRVELLIQEEMVTLKRSLPETEAGAELYDYLQRLLVNQQKTVQQLQLAAEEEMDSRLVGDLKREEEQIRVQMNKTSDQLRAFEIPVGRKISSFLGLGAKKAAPHTVSIPSPVSCWHPVSFGLLMPRISCCRLFSTHLLSELEDSYQNHGLV